MPSFFSKRENVSSTDSGIGNSIMKSESIDKENEEKVSEKEVLLNTIKRQVKQLMEEFVSRKFVHEYSSNVMSLCATVESCLLLGLKRRSLGLFKESSSLALLEKISKQNSAAKLVCNKMAEERKLGIVITPTSGGIYGPGASYFSNTSLAAHLSSQNNHDDDGGIMGSRGSLSSKCSDYSTSAAIGSSAFNNNSNIVSQNSSSTTTSSVFGHSWSASSFLGITSKTESVENEYAALHLKNLKKHYWIRVALTEKVLDKIIDHLVKNSSRYYGKDSIIGDPCDGYILVSLMCGPCSLEYSRLRNPADLIPEDPDACQLVQKQRIQSQCGATGIEAGRSPKLSHAMSTSALFWNTGSTQNLTRPSFGSRQLKLQTGLGVSSAELSTGGIGNLSKSIHNPLISSSMGPTSLNGTGRNYIESLHQTSSSTLLFGKNNVLSQPREDLPKLPGYLSVHMSVTELLIKWTPNALMSGGLNINKSQEHIEKVEWNCAMIIWISKIVSIHCHRQENKGDVLILVNRDGSQNPPFEFPIGGHLVTFLTCLENGMYPNYKLDPPLSSKVNKDQNKLTLKSPPIDRKESPQSADQIRRKPVFLWSSNSSDNDGRTSPSLPSRNINRFFYNRLSWFSSSAREKIGEHKVLMESSESSELVNEEETDKDDKEDWKSDMIFRIIKCHQYNGSRESCSDLTISDDEEDIFGVNNNGLESTEMKGVRSPPPTTQSHNVRHQNTVSNCQSDYNDVARHTTSYHENRITTRGYSTTSEKHTLSTSHKSSIKLLCHSMRKEILARSFYGWLAYCRHMKTIRSHLSQLVYSIDSNYDKSKYSEGLIKSVWTQFYQDTENKASYIDDILKYIYWGGCEPVLRQKVWPYLLGVYDWCNNDKERRYIRKQWARRYDLAVSEWMVVEAIIDEGNNEQFQQRQQQQQQQGSTSSTIPENDDGEESSCVAEIEKDPEKYVNERVELRKLSTSSQEGWQQNEKIIITKEVLQRLRQNLSRIEKDVLRCDRHFEFYGQSETGEANLNVLHRVMCAWVWENITIGYIQGMCDLLAPILVVFNGDEEMAYSCFCRLMEKMLVNFPIGDNNQMDLNFSRMRSAVNILDSDLLEHMQNHGDFTHFYFSYRWFLLDFKREFTYDDLFKLWEVIWCGQKLCSSNFSLFVGLSLFLSYRDIIIDNDMEFTDIIRFFNEMAEKHDIKKILDLSRELVEKLQMLLHS